MRRAYLDHNASSVLRPEARAAMVRALESHGNASSIHGEGRAQRALIEKARTDVAALVGARAEGVVFCASATEAANLALSPDIRFDGEAQPASTLYVCATEHACVLEGGRFPASRIVEVPVFSSGLIDEAAFQTLLDNDAGRPFLALQMVNSETGVIQPVARMAAKVRERGGYTLCDAVQAAGRVPIDVSELGVDFVLLSAHKLGGPQGVGALVIIHAGLDIDPLVRGGGQEKNRRAGTENVAAIAGFGAAARDAAKDARDMSAISALRDSLEAALVPICRAAGLSADDLVIFGAEASRAANTTLFAVRGLKAETALIGFDLEGVAVSSGSACSSGKVGRSHVLSAMGVPGDLASGAIRVSLGWNSTEEDVEAFKRAFTRIISRHAKTAAQQSELSGAA